jgi:hypothetical protein
MKDAPEVSSVFLVDPETKEVHPAELWDNITEKNLADWEAKWIPELYKQLEALHDAGVDRSMWPQSRHWNWKAKTQEIESRLDQQCFSIVSENMTQAMMITQQSYRAKIESQRNEHLVYIDFLEAAPWNRRELQSETAKYAGCGSILIRAAVEFSKLESFKGRVGLHSLPQSNDFYCNKIGMTDLGRDPAHQNLRYFEMTPEQAELFLNGGE